MQDGFYVDDNIIFSAGRSFDRGSVVDLPERYERQEVSEESGPLGGEGSARFWGDRSQVAAGRNEYM